MILVRMIGAATMTYMMLRDFKISMDWMRDAQAY